VGVPYDCMSATPYRAESSTGADRLQRPVRRSRSCSIPIADGKDSEEILGSTAYLHPKGPGDKSMPIKPGTAEDAYIVARQDPCDMAKAGLLKVQGPSVNGGPLATASDRQVDSSYRQADGLHDLCGSSTAQ
jgi:hypothetical protein